MSMEEKQSIKEKYKPNLKGHWTSSASSPNFFSKKLIFLYH